MDSTTCLGLAIDRYGKEMSLHCLFHTDRMHEKEIEASKKIADIMVVEHLYLDTGRVFFSIVTCSLLSHSTDEIPVGGICRAAQQDRWKTGVYLCAVSETDCFYPLQQALPCPKSAA